MSTGLVGVEAGGWSTWGVDPFSPGLKHGFLFAAA